MHQIFDGNGVLWFKFAILNCTNEKYIIIWEALPPKLSDELIMSSFMGILVEHRYYTFKENNTSFENVQSKARLGLLKKRGPRCNF